MAAETNQLLSGASPPMNFDSNPYDNLDDLVPTSIPVLLIFFNRPWALKQSFEAIGELRPEFLYLASDGPRSKADILLVEECRRLVSQIHWPCQVTRVYSDRNQGMRETSLNAISKALELHNGVLVLEDDCVPSKMSLQFISKVLGRENRNSRVASIGLYNPIGKTPFTKDLYSASASFRGWGQYIRKPHWDEYIQTGIREELSLRDCIKESLLFRGFLTKLIKFRILTSHRRKVGHGDISLTIFLRSRGYLSIVPSQSLVSNIGIGFDATHTKSLPPGASLSLRPYSGKTGLPRKLKLRHRIDILEGWQILSWGLFGRFLRNRES